MVISTTDGAVNFENIDYGNYIIKETNAPQGYDVSDTLTKVSEDDFLKDETNSILVGTITDLKTKVKVTKIIEFYKKSLDGTLLSGAIFALYKEDDDKFENVLGQAVSDINGLVQFNNIEEGNYKIKEIKAPDGYNLADTIIHVTDSEFTLEGQILKTNPGTIIDKVITSTGSVIDSKSGAASPVATNVIVENDTKSVSVKAQDTIVFKEPDGTKSPLSDYSKLGFSSTDNPDVEISSDGNIKIKNLPNGTDEKINVTFDLGNGEKIVIGTINVKVSNSGDVSCTSQLVDPYGIVTDAATGKVIDGVHLTLYYANTDRNKKLGKTPDTVVNLPEIVGFKPSNNNNPQVSDANGVYAFMVYPTSDYYIVATRDGYNKFISPTISVEKELVKFDVKMSKLNEGSNSSTESNSSSLNNSGADEFKQDESYGDSNLNNKGQNKVLPQAGRFIDFTVLMSCGIFLILLGIAYKFRKKFLIK